MEKRIGEKVGWIGGWLGGFLWTLFLSFVFLFQGKFAGALIGILLFAAAIGAVFFFAPWRHPARPYWQLMLPIYLILLGAFSWAATFSGGLEPLGLKWWNVSWAFLFLMPLATGGRLQWENHGKKHSGESPP